VSTWGSDSFENDGALDWIADFCDAPAKELVLNALARVAEMDFFDSPSAPECSVGIAAAEVVAALKGEPRRAIVLTLPSSMSFAALVML
jgi:hypothetical protein